MNLSETNISNEISFILENDENVAVSSSHSRGKQKLLEHIYSGTDVILITSSKQKTGALFLQQCFDDHSEQIRTIFLNSASFPQGELESNSPSHDLSMISAVVYESIHLDTHFAIVMDDADQLPLPILNELIKLALAINTSKNNVNFIFAGQPGLLGIIQQVSDITRLGLAHCSLDEITEDDIQVYIEDKQSESIESKKLKFNKYALKRISSHANGNLHKASALLEWCRIYAIHTSNFKITAGFIDEILTNPECNQLLSSYPTTDFSFAASTKSISKDNDRDENVEFSKQNITQATSDSITKVSKTVYIDETSLTTNKKDNVAHKNVYEKVMSTATNDVVSINGSADIGVSLNDADNTESSPEVTYKDTHYIDALKDINNPLSPTYADEDILPKTPIQTEKNSTPNSAYLWVLLALSAIISSYYFFTTKSANEPVKTISSPPSTVNTPIPQKDATVDTTKQKITALIKLAESQISQKKLSTPPSDNAMETYRLILELDHNNEQALSGIKLIKERYRTWAKLDIKDGNSKRAIYFLQRAIDISPDEEALNLLADLE